MTNNAARHGRQIGSEIPGFRRIVVAGTPLYVPNDVLTEDEARKRESGAVPSARAAQGPRPGPRPQPRPDPAPRESEAPPTMPRQSPDLASRVAVVHVRGRRVAWSVSPHWNPASAAMGPAWDAASAAGEAAVGREKPHRVVRDLLNAGVKGVLVFSDSARIVYVVRPDKGGSIRAAWSEDVGWNPISSGRSTAYARAHALGKAGITYGVGGLKEALTGLG